MRAVLMAGGSGTRLRPLTYDLPKPMVPILNRPIAEHIIHLLKSHGITEVITTLHFLPGVVQDYFQQGDAWDVTMTYAVEEDQPLGTAGCVKNCEELLTETFLVISGDSLTNVDLSAAIEFHRRKGSKATLILTRMPNPLEFGVVITDGDDRIQRFIEKPSTSEVFSDTVNTGTYIFEPEVLEYLAANQEADFSTDLFPMLLAQGEPMYGYVAEGYWCDIGHLEAYRQAHYDCLSGHITAPLPYEQRSNGVWVGQNTYIHETAQLEGPLIIGNNCRIGPRARLSAGTVLGDHVTVGASARLDRPIAWNGVVIGEEAHLEACVLARGARVERRAHISEGVVIGSLSTVGEEAHVSPYVRIWPSKRVESGAILNINLIWGHTAQRNLFGQRGVSGLANIDITPEFAVKLGAAYGSTLKPGAQVAVSRDQRSIARMVSRSLISGLMSVGVNVYNLQSTAIPMARAVVPTLPVQGGIHIRIHPDRPDSVLIEFFDNKGINLPKAKEKKIEGAFFKEDLRRVQMHEIGNVIYPGEAIEIYSRVFENCLNIGAIRNSGAKVVIDYAYSVSGAVLPQLLAKFGGDAVVLNASLQQQGPTVADREALLIQLGHVVEALRANFGVQVAANGEQLILVDESGVPIRGEQLTALMVHVSLTARPRGTVIVPVYCSSAIEQIAHRHDGRVIRTKVNPTALMEACNSHPNVVIGGSSNTGYIFPQLHPGFDSMFCIAKLLEMLTIQERSLGEIRSELPTVFHRSYAVRCPWNSKGGLMRDLIETHPAECLELIDGVKIWDRDHDRWVLILPDAGEPLVHIIANANERSWVDRMILTYRSRIQSFVDQHQNTSVDRFLHQDEAIFS